MNVFESLLRQPDDEDYREPRPLREAQEETLSEIYKSYIVRCPYVPGDFVTPRKTSGQPDYLVGEPHIVLEVLRGNDIIEEGDAPFISRLDMRVAVLFDGVYVTPWVESFKFEPYQKVEV